MAVNAAGDPKTGANKAQVCTACHGAQGISVNPEWPNLAGQHTAYLIKELHDFKQGTTRNAPTMTPMTTSLTDEDIENIAAYFSQKQCAPGNISKSHVTRGETLYRNGDREKHITACIACHGPDAKGNAQAGFPMLSSQQSAYTIQQLLAFKSGQRKNDIGSIMQNISSHMTNEDMEAVAHYLAGSY